MYTAYSPVQLSLKRLTRTRTRDTEYLLMTNEMLLHSMLRIRQLGRLYLSCDFISQVYIIHC